MVKSQLADIDIETKDGVIKENTSNITIDNKTISTSEFSYNANELLSVELKGEQNLKWEPSIKPKDLSTPIEEGINYKPQTFTIIGTVHKQGTTCDMEAKQYVLNLTKSNSSELHIETKEGQLIKHNLTSINALDYKLRIMASVIKDIEYKDIYKMSFYIDKALISEWIAK
jgi:frataxin-like iron-binding protein CyaY